MAEAPKRRQLGRGLSALLGDVKPATQPDSVAAGGGETSAGAQSDGQSGAARRAYRSLPTAHLKPGRYQPRHHMDEAHIDELAASVKERGILQPILVRPEGGATDSFEIIAGERRWRAAQKAQLHEVPVIVRDLSDQEALEIALIENLQREDLSAIEEARAFQRLLDEFGHTQDELSRALGKSRSHVTNTLRLLALPEDVQGMVEDGCLSAGHARALVGAQAAGDLARTIIDNGLTVREAEKLAAGKGEGEGKGKGKPKTGTKGAGRGAAAAKDADTVALEREVSNILGLPVDVAFNGQGGAVTIRYQSLDQLDDLLHRLTHGTHGRRATGPAETLEELEKSIGLTPSRKDP